MFDLIEAVGRWIAAVLSAIAMSMPSAPAPESPASEPMPVTPITTSEQVPERIPEQVPVETHAPSREERCWAAINAVVASGLEPAPGFTFQCGPNWNTSADGQTPSVCDDGSRGETCHGVIRIHPDDADSDAHWRRVVRHEIGHSWCAHRFVDFSEGCAQQYE